MTYVLDASTALGYVFSDEDGDYSRWVLTTQRHDTAFVPGIFPIEILNALLVAERRGRITPAEGALLVDALADLLIEVQPDPWPARSRSVIDLARMTRLSAYDASYLHLAQWLGAPIATQDQRLRQSAASLGIPVLLPQDESGGERNS